MDPRRGIEPRSSPWQGDVLAVVPARVFGTPGKSRTRTYGVETHCSVSIELRGCVFGGPPRTRTGNFSVLSGAPLPFGLEGCGSLGGTRTHFSRVATGTFDSSDRGYWWTPRDSNPDLPPCKRGMLPLQQEPTGD